MIETYHFPDTDMLENTGMEFDLRIWQPDSRYIVLGNSDKMDASVFVKKAKRDKISIVQRPTGGHSVFLSPKMISVSMVLRKDPLPTSMDFFLHGNRIIVKALERLGVKELSLEGISDIALSGKKLVGTALYRNRSLVFYHAIINLGEAPEEIAKYLKYPVKVPDYRKNRSHADFVTSLWKEGYLLGFREFNNSIEHTVKIEKSHIF